MNWLTSYLGERQTATTNETDVFAEPAYWLTNFSLGTGWEGEHVKWAVRGKIDNLFNAGYSNLKDRPMPMRNYSILLKIEF
mgnify:CR=1 FL=1